MRKEREYRGLAPIGQVVAHWVPTEMRRRTAMFVSSPAPEDRGTRMQEHDTRRRMGV